MKHETKVFLITLFDRFLTKLPTITLIFYLILVVFVIASLVFHFDIKPDVVTKINLIIIFLNFEVLLFAALSRKYVGGSTDGKFCPVRIIQKQLMGEKQLDRLYQRSVNILKLVIPLAMLLFVFMIWFLIW